ncbi:MAG: aquaporin [Alphaproteobacteria bacterium]|uniref:Putative Major intrinsic protein n=1 Tax=uncultured marine crenarchaeote HF4000_ANIW133I6 TaxID=455571 RepID=B3T414_9ARCH|nr:putative Major intrinsic protein [uncultured marine crenarchaeote HF4000_ANIW133I6]RUA19077.1 MAG: aquaporin [Alphaproteobacteria bacterium]
MVNPRNWFAEAIATYALVFFGPLAIILSVVAFGDGLSIESIIMISLAHGAAIGLMVYAFGHISGAHINPAVTIPMMITKKISVADGIGYIIFQLIGAVVAAFSLKAILPEIGAKVNFGTQGGPSELLNNSVMAGITVEIILTFFLVTVIFLTAVHKKAPAGIHGISIGGMVFLLHLVGVPLTGASMNPARTFGPAVVSGFWELHWLYWVAPIIGGIIAGVIMNYIFVNNAEPETKRRSRASSIGKSQELDKYEKQYLAKLEKKPVEQERKKVSRSRTG